VFAALADLSSRFPHSRSNFDLKSAFMGYASSLRSSYLP